MFIPVKDDEFNDAIKAAMSCEPVNDFELGTKDVPVQKRDKKTHLPVWSIECAYRHGDDYESEFMTIKLPYATDPNIVLGPIRFGGLKLRTWDMGGKNGLAISADSFTQDIRTDKATASAGSSKASASK